MTSGAVSDAKEAITMMDLPNDNKKKLRGTGNLKMKQDKQRYFLLHICINLLSYHSIKLLTFNRCDRTPLR